MPATSVVHSNSITGTMALADVRGFLRSCDAEDLPEDVVIRVRTIGRRFGRPRIAEISASTKERLSEERNEPASIRRALDLPPTASSQEVLRVLRLHQEGLDDRLQHLTGRLERAEAEAVEVRGLIGLAPDCAQDTMLEVLAECLEPSEAGDGELRPHRADQSASTSFHDLVHLGNDLGEVLGVRMHPTDQPVDYMRRLVESATRLTGWLAAYNAGSAEKE